MGIFVVVDFGFVTGFLPLLHPYTRRRQILRTPLSHVLTLLYFSDTDCFRTLYAVSPTGGLRDVGFILYRPCFAYIEMIRSCLEAECLRSHETRY